MFYFAPEWFAFSPHAKFQFWQNYIWQGRGPEITSVLSQQPNSFFGNFIFRIGTVWFLPACQILDLGMFYLAEAFFRFAGEI